MSRKLLVVLLSGLLTLSFVTSPFAQTQAPDQQAPAAAAPEKKSVEATAPEKKPGVPEDPKKHTSLGL
jgi:hypothetical protein